MVTSVTLGGLSGAKVDCSQHYGVLSRFTPRTKAFISSVAGSAGC